MRLLNKSLIFCSLTFLSGCLNLTPSSEEQAQNLIPTPSLDNTVEKALDTPFFSVGSWPEENWWDVFTNLQLNELMNRALAQNPTLQSIQRQVENAKQRSIIARGQLFPLLFFNASDNLQFLSKNGLYRALNPNLPLSAGLIDMTLAFTYEFDFWSKYRNIFQAALGREKAEEASQAQVKLIITTAVAQAFFALKTNLIKAELYRDLCEVRKNIFNLQNLLLKNALSSKLPVYLSEEVLLESEKLIFAIEEEVEVDKHLLNILIGNGPDVPLGIDAELPSLPKTLVIPECLSLNLLSRRPDLMAQIWRVEALAHEIGVARADFFPNINLSAILGLESFHFSNLFNGSSGTGSAEPAFTLPIYTAGTIQANIDSKRALFDAALFDYNDLLLKSAQEVADLLVLAKSIYGQQSMQAVIVGCADARYGLTELRKQNGLDNDFQIYALQEEVIQKKLANIDLIYGQYLATVKLIKALGGGYASDFLPIAKGEK